MEQWLYKQRSVVSFVTSACFAVTSPQQHWCHQMLQSVLKHRDTCQLVSTDTQWRMIQNTTL